MPSRVIDNPSEEDPMLSALKIADRRDWTVDDLATLPKDLRYELIDGRLVLPSATGIHQDICFTVVTALQIRCPRTLLAAFDLSLRVDRRNEPRPDVVVYARKEANVSPAPIESVVLAVEVISPDSNIRDLHTKPRLYAKAGIGSYWVIDPFHDAGVTLAEFRLGGDGQYELLSETNKVFTVDLPFRVELDLPAMTAVRQETLEMAGENDQN
jgi:Uma2 family endonuclease